MKTKVDTVEIAKTKIQLRTGRIKNSKLWYSDSNLSFDQFLRVDFKTLLTQSLSANKISHSDHPPRHEYHSNLENKEIPNLNCF